MSKHTPGPWILSGPMGTGHLHGREPEFRVYAHRTLFLEVCADPDGYAHGENEANARLIAAAPELLETLREVRKQARHPDYDWSLDLQREVDAVIAKATGEPA